METLWDSLLESNLQGGLKMFEGGGYDDTLRSRTTTPSMPRGPTSQVSRDLRRSWASLRFGCRPTTVLGRGAFIALSRWLGSVRPSSLLGHLEPRSLFSAEVRAAGGGQAGDRPRPGGAGGSLSSGAPRPGGRVGALFHPSGALGTPERFPSKPRSTRSPRTCRLSLEGWDHGKVGTSFSHPRSFGLYLPKESCGLGGR